MSVNSIDSSFTTALLVKLLKEAISLKHHVRVPSCGLLTFLFLRLRGNYTSSEFMKLLSLPPPISLALEKVSVGVGANSVLLQRL